MSTKSTSSLGALEDAVLESLQALVFGLKARLRHQATALPQSLSHMEMRALQFFVRHPGCTQRDLVAHSGRDKAQITRLIRPLLESGLLRAEVDPADRRSQRLFVSEAGQAAHAVLQKARREVLARSLNGLDAAELQQLQGLLQRLHANLGEPD